MDIVTPEQRSKNMAAIRSKDTKPEVYFRKLLFAKGYRYSLNSKTVSLVLIRLCLTEIL